MDIESAFSFFGVTPLEAKLYVSLLQHGALNGSELARLQNLTRASVYASLQNLTEKGVVRMIPGNPQRFEAVPYKALTKRFAQKSEESLEAITKTLAILPEPTSTAHVLNFSDMEQFNADVLAQVEGAKKEIYISACRNLHFLEEALRAAARRGVRIILFSFYDNPGRDSVCGIKLFKGLETYTRPSLPICFYKSERFMSVVDMEYAHSGGFSTSGSFLGIASANSLFVKIMAEHIHHDIYFAKIEARDEKNPVDKRVLIHSMHEISR
jgi:sugar-specific transcriptional regulator TrmB